MEVSPRKHPQTAPTENDPTQLRLLKSGAETPALDPVRRLAHWLSSTAKWLCTGVDFEAACLHSTRQLSRLRATKLPSSPLSLGRRRPKAWHPQTALLLALVVLLVYIVARQPRGDLDLDSSHAYQSRYHPAAAGRARQLSDRKPTQLRLATVTVPPGQTQTASDGAEQGSRIAEARPVRHTHDSGAKGGAFSTEAVGRVFETALGNDARWKDVSVLSPENIMHAFQVSEQQRPQSLPASSAEVRLPAQRLGSVGAAAQRLPRAVSRVAQPADRALSGLSTFAKAGDGGSAPAAEPAAATAVLPITHSFIAATPAERARSERPIGSLGRKASVGVAAAAPAVGLGSRAKAQGAAARQGSPAPISSASGEALADAAKLLKIARGGDHEEFVDFEVETAAPAGGSLETVAEEEVAAGPEDAGSDSSDILDLFLRGIVNNDGPREVSRAAEPNATAANGQPPAADPEDETEGDPVVFTVYDDIFDDDDDDDLADEPDDGQDGVAPDAAAGPEGAETAAKPGVGEAHAASPVTTLQAESQGIHEAADIGSHDPASKTQTAQ